MLLSLLRYWNFFCVFLVYFPQLCLQYNKCFRQVFQVDCIPSTFLCLQLHLILMSGYSNISVITYFSIIFGRIFRISQTLFYILEIIVVFLLKYIKTGEIIWLTVLNSLRILREYLYTHLFSLIPNKIIRENQSFKICLSAFRFIFIFFSFSSIISQQTSYFLWGFSCNS